MNPYKLIACDLDGTLIGSDLTLSEENRRAIKELTEMGVAVVPATGRTICEMEEVFRLTEIRYVIYSNGAAICDKLTGETAFLGLDETLSRFVFHALKQFDAFPIIHKDGKTYAEKEKSGRMKQYHLGFNVENLVKENCILEDDLKQRFENGGVECLAVFFTSQEERDACLALIENHPDLYAVKAWEYNLEIFSKKAGKGNALRCLAQKLGMEMDNVISVGDSDNDRQMISVAGLGLATANSCASLKKVADAVICSNDEHVMQYVKEHYLKEKV